MRKKLPRAVLMLCLIAMILFGFAMRATKAQDAAPAVPTPQDVIDQIMGQIGQARFDQALSMMDGLKNEPDLREAARAKLIQLRENQGSYRGYDIAAIQRFTGQFETVDVLGNFDQQPVLFQFHFYRAQKQDDAKWTVLGFAVTTNLAEITDILKDTPVDYVGRKP